MICAYCRSRIFTRLNESNALATVTALRLDDFEGPIRVSLDHLPPGSHATGGVIGSGQMSTTLLLSADADTELTRASR